MSTDDNPIVWPGEEAQSSTQTGGGTDLAALILEKIAAFESGQQNGGDAPEADDVVDLPEKVVEVYTQVGLILSRYKSGKLPKPFKILPSIPAWETLVVCTMSYYVYMIQRYDI